MNDIVAAFIGGGVGGLLGGLLMLLFPEKWRKTWGVAVMVACAVGGGRIGPMLAPSPPVTVASLEAELLASNLAPLVSTWETSDPSGYQAFLRSIQEGLQEGRKKDELVAEARAHVMAAAVPRMTLLPDAQIVGGIKLTSEQFAVLARTKPSVCFAMFNGQPFGDITDALGPELVRRETALLSAALAMSGPLPTDLFESRAMDDVIQRVIENTRAKVGDDVALLGETTLSEGQAVRFCEVAAVFNSEVANLPEADAARFMRTLLLRRET